MKELLSLIENCHNKSSLSNFKQDIIRRKLNDEDINLIKELFHLDQSHLFESWPTDNNIKNNFITSLKKVNVSYPGGFKSYIKNAKKLLKEAKEGKNPFDGFTPTQPDMVDLSEFNEKYFHYESLGLQNISRLAIVMVAGGLGERLGYNGIKIDIPVEVLTMTSYFEHYANSILALEARSSGVQIPFVIMTSGDTNKPTLESLKKNNYFGLKKEQVFILKQELVPAISDNDAHFVVENNILQLKPHGHGDVHMLLYSSGVAQKLFELKKEYLLFIQDTNAQVSNIMLSSLGVSIEENFDFNSIAVNRYPKEAVGALTKLKSKEKTLTLNVEYNQLEPLLKATVSPKGDIPNEKGFSIFPGNINVLLIKLDSYLEILKQTKGIIAEFINPKYANEEKTAFKKPTRLETMMQDLPKLFTEKEKVGVTIFNRRWCFSADKNNPSDAKIKYEAGGPSESAATAESDFYFSGRQKCRLAGNNIEDAPDKLIMGIPYSTESQIYLKPSFAMSLSEVKEKIKKCSFKTSSVLILDGKNIQLENVTLEKEATLEVHLGKETRLLIKDLVIDEKGYEQVYLSSDDLISERIPQYFKIRGYFFKKHKSRFLFNLNEKGNFVLTKNGIQKLED